MPIFVIPAFQPTPGLLDLVRKLRALTEQPILIVNDGSHPDRDPIFNQVAEVLNVHVLRHAVNLGKGAALKTALNYAILNFPASSGAVTLDADGQHLPEDAIRVADELSRTPDSLILGCRRFGRANDVPLRSQFGNLLTRLVFRTLTGVAVSDTQTGLRGIPASFMKKLLRVAATGYEFETDMLALAVRSGIRLKEIAISTIYLDGNSNSHFNPILDSIRIYFVFIRFAFNSIATASLDLIVFVLTHYLTGNLLAASVMGRTVGGTFNFFVSRSLVFKSRGRAIPEALRFASLVALFGFLSNASIGVLVSRLGINVYFSKVLVETSLFLLSFAAQRLIIFPVSKPRNLGESTDWDTYYQKPFKATSITRKITTRRILNCLRRYGAHLGAPTILELGGGNSCVFGAISKEINPAKYIIVDKNRTGLEKFHSTYPDAQRVELIEDDVLELKNVRQPADICFSIGLIEHFCPSGTREAIRAHFNCVAPNGIVLITYPTPTWLYRITRGIAEALNLWQFPDERPCTVDEVSSVIQEFAEIKHSSIIWPIFLTQGLLVAQSRQNPKVTPV